MPKANLEEITPAELAELARRIEAVAIELRDAAAKLQDGDVVMIELATQTARMRISQLESFAGSAAKRTRRTVDALREQAVKDKARASRAAQDGVPVSPKNRNKNRR